MLKLSAETPYISFTENPEHSIIYYQSNGKTDKGYCVRLKTSLERCKSAVEEIYTAFEEHGLPITVILTPKSGPEEIQAHLEARGLSMIISNPAMVADLMKLKQERPSPEGLSIDCITDDSGMDLFRDIYYEGFEENRGTLDYHVNSTKMLGYATDFPIRSYVGYMNDEPVATSQLIYLGGVAGLFSVVVLPEHRGRGLGTAMTLDTLRMAIPEGYRFGVLWATPMGINIYRKLGFQELFTPKVYTETGGH